MKFTAEDPSEVAKSGSGGVDRSQGAARAISVGAHKSLFFILGFSIFLSVIHRPRLEMGRP